MRRSIERPANPAAHAVTADGSKEPATARPSIGPRQCRATRSRRNRPLVDSPVDTSRPSGAASSGPMRTIRVRTDRSVSPRSRSRALKTRNLRAFSRRGTEESNLALRFWRPPCYRYTSPPKVPICRYFVVCVSSFGSKSERKSERAVRRDVAPDGHFASPLGTQDTLSEPAAGPDGGVPNVRGTTLPPPTSQSDDHCGCSTGESGRQDAIDGASGAETISLEALLE